MNNAIYAIPGLMPPTAPNWKSNIYAPEDGSLCMCVYCGRTGDEVNYAILRPGWRSGVIKDPSYHWVEGTWEARIDRSSHPQFMTVSDTIPPDAIIPNYIIHDHPIPVTERPDIAEADKLYWIINLPMRTLPIGDTEVQIVVNGRVRKWHVQRQAFAIHRLDDLTKLFEKFNNQSDEYLDVAFKAGAGGTILLDIKASLANVGSIAEIMSTASYRASMDIHETHTELETSIDDRSQLTITVPPVDRPGYGLWRAEYKLFEAWTPLCCGDIVITPAN